MNSFYESFQKELGKRSAQIVIAGIVIILSAAVKFLPENMTKLRTLSIGILALALCMLTSGLFFRYLSSRNSKHNNNLLDKEKTNILLFLHKNIDGSFIFQIVQALNISEDIAEYHLQALHEINFIEQGLPDKPGRPWYITDKGTKYLIENKLIP